MLSLCLSLFTHTERHIHSQATLWAELTNLCGEVHVSQTFILQAQRLRSAAAQLTSPSHPEIETRSNSAYKSVCLCWLWQLHVGLFTFNPARGQEYGTPPEAGNSSHGEWETGDIQAVTELAGKYQTGRLLGSTVRHLNAACEESWAKAVLPTCPRGVREDLQASSLTESHSVHFALITTFITTASQSF